jgi:alpha-glucosidase (family GH31 glycosyl hydrolase)
MIPWSGDVSRSWGGLQSQVGISVQMGMQGMAYMHSDLGGFAGDYFDNELYLRWLQYGVFNPIFRPHAQEDVASEVAYKDIVTKEKAKKQVELRYQLLPYNYTLAFENNQKGLPLMRPFYMENNSSDIKSDQYYWGANFLVKPITSANIKETEVQFPNSNFNWFDFYSDKEYASNTTSKIEVAEDHIPVFVAGGSFIPRIKTITNTSEYSLDNFDLHYYFDEKAIATSGSVYNDDGVTPNAFEKGNYELLKFSSSLSKGILKINFTAEIGKNFASKEKLVNLILHTIQPKKVFLNGKESAFIATTNQTEISISWEKGTKPEIIIEY